MSGRGGGGDVARRLTVRGEVQGVGYRATTAREAQRLGLTGWVRNEVDGSVTAHAEGPADAVEALVAWCRRGPTHARVDDVAVEVADPQGRASFQVSG